MVYFPSTCSYDSVCSLVLSHTITKHQNIHNKLFCTDKDDPEKITNQSRKLGLVVIRGTQVSLVSPEEGTEEIANPFLGGGEEEEEEGS